MTANNKDGDEPSATPSICEEALEGYRSAEDTFAGLIDSNHIEVRDFMILSFVCDQGSMQFDRIQSALGLSKETVHSCISRLRDVDLVSFSIDEYGQILAGIRPTALGRAIARRIHERVDS